MLSRRPLLRRFSAVPATFRTLQLPVGVDGSSLLALAPCSFLPEQPKLLCLSSTFGSVARDFRLQFASEQLTRSFALHGVELRLPDREFGRKRVERDADEVLRAADALKLETFALLGCNHGANVGAVLAAKAPERVTRLVLVNGNAFVSDEDVEDMDEYKDINSWPKDMRETAQVKCGGLTNLQDKWTEMVEALRQVEREDGGDLYCGHLPHIKCKTLVVSGGRDMFVPLFHGEYLSERIMHSRLNVIPEGGHDLVLSEAERFNTLLETFLHEPDDKLTQSREFVAVPSKV